MDSGHQVGLPNISKCHDVEERCTHLRRLTDAGVEIPHDLFGPLVVRFAHDDLVDPSTLTEHVERLILRVKLTKGAESEKFDPLNPSLPAITAGDAIILQTFKDVFNMILRAIIQFAQQSDTTRQAMATCANKIEDTVAGWNVESPAVDEAQQAALLALRNVVADNQLSITKHDNYLL